MTLTIRPAARSDVPDILRLVRALAAYEREPEAVMADEAMLDRVLFAEGGHVHGHVATRDGRVVGIAVWFLNFSTWTGRPGLYLEDLFVEESERGRGTGRALMATLAREAEARGCARLEWSVLDWNEPAMAFYRSLGARRAEAWQPWRLEGEAIARLASAGD